jgi:hypothetical protein
MDALSRIDDRLADLDSLFSDITEGSFADQRLAARVAQVLRQLKACVADLTAGLRELEGRIDTRG